MVIRLHPGKQTGQAILTLSIVLMALLSACHRTPELVVSPLDIPAAVPSQVPQVTRIPKDGVAVTWQRPLPAGGYSLDLTILQGGVWSPAHTVASGDLSFYAVDLPGIVPMPNGNLFAYWERKAGSEVDPYATVIETAVTGDLGKTWSTPNRPYADSLSGQHSFLSGFPRPNGIGLAWLDASAQAIRYSMDRAGKHGTKPAEASDPMGSVGLRYAELDTQGKLRSTEFVDPITCECCPTAAATTARGPVIVYRGRLEAPGQAPTKVNPSRPTIRDISITRLENGHWTHPHTVHDDHWIVNACPDNGPAVDAVENNVVVAWWTATDNQRKVQIAFSKDAGDTFSAPVRADLKDGEGQVTVALLPDGKSAIVGWLEDNGTWARYVEANGRLSPAVRLGPSPTHSRLPRWLTNQDGSVTAIWTAGTFEHPVVTGSRIQLRFP